MPIFVLLFYFFVFPFLYYRPAYFLMQKNLLQEAVFRGPLIPIAWLEDHWPAYGKFLYSGIQFTYRLLADPREPPRID